MPVIRNIKNMRMIRSVLRILTDDKREGKEHFKQFDMAAYARMNFGMFGGEEVRVKLHFQNEMVGVLLDRFGKDIPIYKRKNSSMTEVCLSDRSTFTIEIRIGKEALFWSLFYTREGVK